MADRAASEVHASRTSETERLVLLVEKLQRMLFGAKSEKVLRQIDQLELQLEELQAANAIEESKAAAMAERPAPTRPFRRPLPEHLPREVHTPLQTQQIFLGPVSLVGLRKTRSFPVDTLG